jgi:hypothetical protein
MKRILLPLILIFSFALKGQHPFEEGNLLILLKSESAVAAFESKFEATFGAPIVLEKRLAQSMPLFLATFDPNQVITKQALSFAKVSAEVAVVQLNHTSIVVRATPNDPSFSEQWHLFNNGTNGGSGQADMDALQAWDITTGGLTPGGDTIVVAVVDGGYNIEHPDLVDNIFINHHEIPNNGLDDDNNGYIDDINGWNVFNNSGVHGFDNHGNHVAGIIGAKGNNAEGVTGVNWNVKILPITGSSTNDATVAAAYGYILDMRKKYNSTNGAEGAYIVSTNSSFGVDYGDPLDYPLWCAMYDSMGYAGILSAGATANLNINIDQVGDVPTACSSNFLLSVTNTTSSDVKINGAAFGINTIDLGAPGTSIYSTLYNGYGDMTGTSMATPQVAGAVALMYSALCSEVWQAYENNPAGLALYMKDKMLNEGVDQLGSLSNFVGSGGRLNLNKAVRAVSDSCFAAVLEATNTSCGICNGALVASPIGGIAPFQYQWSTGSLVGPFIDSLCAGIYTLTIVDAVGDSAIASITISDSAGPSLTSQVVNVSCNGLANGQIVLSGADAYIWSDGDTSSVRSNLEAGTYFVSATSFNNPCTTISSFIVGEPETITVNVSTAVPFPLTAANGSISLNVMGGSPPYSFEWSSGQATADAFNLPIGNYIITITDNQQCETEVNVLLGYPAGLKDEITDGFFLYPNPTNGLLMVQSLSDELIEATLMDPLGRVIFTRAQSNSGEELVLNLENLNAGWYMIYLKQGDTIRHRKIQLIK